ncbi:MAG: hypothetical protein VB036_06675 [Propionicimonas sp.]|nr:hypothetical protein [Propionicimonas sp.]
MTRMLKRFCVVAAAVTVTLLGSTSTASAAERVPAPPRSTHPAPASICEIWPIFWWCP